MPFAPALGHLELRFHNVYNQPSTFRSKFLEVQEWPTKVKSLRFIAYDQLMDTTSFCAFVKRFALSLKHLSFYISTQQRFLMSTWRTLEKFLLDYLSNLNQIDFCVHSGVANIEIDRRRLFDRWTKKQVISVFHSLEFHTRFTIPFAFDRLEYVSNDFVDYRCNRYQSNVTLSLSSIVMITFYSKDKLNLSLFILIQRTCPSLRYLRFKNFCDLTEDLIQNTIVTLPTVTELCLSDVASSINSPVLHRIFSLIPNLKHLTTQRRHITAIDTMDNDTKMLRHVKVTIVECSSSMNNNQDN
ncbi:unnamed protein product [Rotaria sp. Silwood2]|nr:unnamed protein product [Rotaria sp. Silwood2]